MREILFRGKRMDNGEWLVSGTLLQSSDDERFCWMPVYGDKFGTAEDDKGNILRMEYGTLYRVDPATVGQYTGLKDKNGKRIFEGDIVRVQDNLIFSPFCDGLVGKVVYIETAFFIEPKDPTKSEYLFNECAVYEVLGNIHDNPELMEVR